MGNCPTLRRMPFLVFLVPPLDSTHSTPVATPLPQLTTNDSNTAKCPLGAVSSPTEKITLLFSTNESLLLGRALSGPKMPRELRSRLPLPASTAGLAKLAASASFTDCYLLQVHFGAMEMLPVYFFFFKLFIYHCCVWSSGGILSINLWSQLDRKSASQNLIFCFVWN